MVVGLGTKKVFDELFTSIREHADERVKTNLPGLEDKDCNKSRKNLKENVEETYR